MGNSVKVTIDVESAIVQRKLAEAQEMLAKAAEHNKALSALIERQRQEIQLLRGALGMEWCRVAWRPVSDEGFKNAMGKEMLIVYKSPIMSVGAIIISKWDEMHEWGMIDDRFVTHWAPLPGLPEEG